MTVDELASRVRARFSGGRGPHVVGVTGGVAAGKSTISNQLADIYRAQGTTVHILPTDAFLFPNEVLGSRNLGMRKGFPETYDLDAMAAAVQRVKSGAAATTTPVYSHEVYDILPGRDATIGSPDVLILEGVVALQAPAAHALDVALYVDAAEDHIKRWFVQRFVALTDAAKTDPSSFYARFTRMPPDALTAFAGTVWDEINGPNLREHILPTRSRATIVVEKAEDHTIVAIRDGAR